MTILLPVIDDERVEFWCWSDAATRGDRSARDGAIGRDANPRKHREERAHSIGGAPQLVKVYEHLNTQSFAVKWGASGEEAFLQGRPLLSYENVDVWIMDPVTLRTVRPSPPKGRINDSQRKVFYRKLVAVLRKRVAAAESKSE